MATIELVTYVGKRGPPGGAGWVIKTPLLGAHPMGALVIFYLAFNLVPAFVTVLLLPYL